MEIKSGLFKIFRLLNMKEHSQLGHAIVIKYCIFNTTNKEQGSEMGDVKQVIHERSAHGQ